MVAGRKSKAGAWPQGAGARRAHGRRAHKKAALLSRFSVLIIVAHAGTDMGAHLHGCARVRDPGFTMLRRHRRRSRRR